tara:strand:- start:500 stop:3751 length:3252 start_codon:yes stop_codon:yes gene_type:complete
MSQQSFHQQTANGSNIAFTITTFSEDEIKVYVDGVESTNGGSSQNDYTIPNYTTSGGTVTWNTSGSLTAPASPSVVRVIRQTDVMNNGNTAVEGKATFQAGSSVKAGDLNDNTKQALRAIKEQQDQKIQSYDIEPNAILTAAIKDDAVTMDKIADGSLPTGVTVASANIVDGTIVNADINASAAIAGTKISPNFGSQVISTTGNITVGGTVDGRDIANDGTKLDSIETGATADQTNAEIKTAYEANADTNAFQDAEKTKLAGIESGATADQTAAEIRAAVEAASDSNVFTDADHSKLNAIEAGATADQTNAEIKTAYEANADTNAFQDAEKTKLAGIETAATADQTDAEIKTAYENNSNTNAFTDAEKTKLSGIETAATADQTNAEIKTAYEANANTNEFSDAEQTKLANIETAATADQTASEIKTLLQSDKLTLSEINTTSTDSRYFTETELTNGALDGRYYTETEAEARFLRQDSSETIASGQTWSNSDAFVATTAAINARIVDLIDDVGGFTAITSEQHFPNTNPQGTAGQAAILSIQAASTTLTPSGTTVTISNGNLANNANITITGVPSAIPTGFGFLVESTSTLHTYTFHRLVPKATEVTTVANNITNIVNAGANVVDINNFADIYQISGSAPTQRADGTSLQEGDLWFDSSNDNLLVYTGSAFSIITPSQSVLDDVAIVSGAITYSEDLGLITSSVSTGSSNGSLDIVADVLEDEITFTVTVINSGGNKYVIDGDTSNPAKALTLYKGWTYTFDQSDSSNANHPLVFKTDSGSYTTNVTVTGTAGQAGAKVQIVIPETQPTGNFRYYCSVHGNAMGNLITVKDDPLKTVSDNITDIVAVANNSSNINSVHSNATNINAVQANASNINAAVSNASNINSVVSNATNINTVANSISNVNSVGSNISNVNSVHSNASNINSAVSNATNINSVAGSISNVNTTASNIANVNNFASTYQIASSNPSQDGGGNALAAGDLYFNTSSNELRVYNGSSWQGGVTATGNLAGLGANTFSGNISFTGSQTVDGRDVSVDGSKLDGIEAGATGDQTASEIVSLISGQTIAPNVITTTNLTLDFGSIA